MNKLFICDLVNRRIFAGCTFSAIFGVALSKGERKDAAGLFVAANWWLSTACDISSAAASRSAPECIAWREVHSKYTTTHLDIISEREQPHGRAT